MVASTLAAVFFGSVAPAHAFRDHLTFAAPAIEGGTEGRYFTGSPRDGHTCAVCHVGGAPPTGVMLSGLPELGYELGASYTLLLTFPNTALPDDDVETTAGALEITDALGDPVGTLEPFAFPESADECEPELSDDPQAVFIENLPDGRQVAVMNECGADRLAVTWTAPAQPRAATVWGAVVAGNGRTDPSGDGVEIVVRPLTAIGDVADPMRVANACGVAEPGRGAPLPRAFGWFGLGVALLCRRERPR